MNAQTQINQYFNNARMTMQNDIETTAALSLYCNFDTEQERDAWFKDHVKPQNLHNGGPIFCWSTKDESTFTDLNTELLAALEKAIMWCDMSNTPDRVQPKKWITDTKELIKKARGNNE